MAGYCDDFSMSNNAVDAYERGLKPVTKWTKKEILCGIESYGFDSSFFQKWNHEELKKLLVYSEWHHTSAGFNRTCFFDLDVDAIERYANGELEKPCVKVKKEKKEFEEGYWHGKYKCTEYHPFSRYEKYREWYEEFTNARKKGNWIILPNGKRKNFSNCIDLKKTKTKRKKKKEEKV